MHRPQVQSRYVEETALCCDIMYSTAYTISYLNYEGYSTYIHLNEFELRKVSIVDAIKEQHQFSTLGNS